MRAPSPAQLEKERLLAEAADVGTPAARLLELALGLKPAIVSLVASNPSAPAHALMALLDRYPDEVLANPAWPLVVMTDPRLSEKAAPFEAARTADPERLRELARTPALRLIVAENPAADGELLAELAAPTESPELAPLLARIARHPRCPPATLRRLAGGRALVVARLDIVQAAAGNTSTPADVLVELSHHPHLGVREQLAGNRSTPGEVQRRLATDDGAVQLRLASNRSARLDLLAELATRHDARVREAVAANTGAPGEVLERLLADRSQGVRRAAIANPSLPLPTLQRLAAGRGLDALAARTARQEREPPQAASEPRAPRETGEPRKPRSAARRRAKPA